MLELYFDVCIYIYTYTTLSLDAIEACRCVLLEICYVIIVDTQNAGVEVVHSGGENVAKAAMPLR